MGACAASHLTHMPPNLQGVLCGGMTSFFYQKFVVLAIWIFSILFFNFISPLLTNQFTQAKGATHGSSKGSLDLQGHGGTKCTPQAPGPSCEIRTRKVGKFRDFFCMWKGGGSVCSLTPTHTQPNL